MVYNLIFLSNHFWKLYNKKKIIDKMKIFKKFADSDCKYNGYNNSIVGALLASTSRERGILILPPTG